MDSMDEYLARLCDPAVRSYNRSGFDEENPLPSKPNVTEDHISAAEKALEVALPPSYAAGWLDRSPRALALLGRLEKLAQRSSALASLADHFIVEATRLPRESGPVNRPERRY